MSRHGIYYFQHWLPKHLKNNTFNKSIFRFSLKTTIKQDAKKHVYKIMVMIYDLESKYNNDPNGFGLALLRLQQKIKKISKSDDFNKQIEDDEARIRHGSPIYKQWKVAGINENDIYAMDDFLAQYTLQDLECFVAAKEYYESINQPVQIKPNSSSIKTVTNVTGLMEKLDQLLQTTNPTLSDEDNPTLKIIFNEWKGKYKR